MNELLNLQQTSELIRSGAPLCLAGTEAALARLPAGHWIGGTIPYFMLASGGTVLGDDAVFVTHLAALGDVRFASYGPDALADIAGKAPDNGFSLAIIPAGGRCHQGFADEAANFEGAFLRPTVGWIAGVRVEDVGRVTAKVFDGRTGTAYEDRAVVAYVELPADKLASIEIVNLFEPDTGDLLRFPEVGFEIGDCEVNGENVNFADYVRARGLEHGQLPLVGDFAGAHVNASLCKVGEPGERVQMYAPVFPGVDYRFSRPVGDYAATFRERLAAVERDGVVLACNCVLNFLFGELEGKAIGGFEGPATFGEIAYQLLNQTAVILRVR